MDVCLVVLMRLILVVGNEGANGQSHKVKVAKERAAHSSFTHSLEQSSLLQRDL